MGADRIFQEERNLALGLLTRAEWGFLRPSCGVRNLVQSYIHGCGRNVKKFRDIRLGLDWFKLFMGTHKELIEIL